MARSLVFDGLGNGELWMVDCAEGTIRQFARQPERGPNRFKAWKVSKVFITHMHADHIMGLITMLRTVLRPPWITPIADDVEDREALIPTVPPAKIALYGPAGLRSFVRSCLLATRTRTGDRYVVHELLTADDPITPCDPPEVLHSSELVGQDIRCDEDGYWRGFTSAMGTTNEVVVDAGPIIHRDPCIGYIFHEPLRPQRKLVLLGDTYDSSALIPLVTSLPGPTTSLLVHEATDAYIPPAIDPQSIRTPETVQQKCVERGHSTPVMAGNFARAIKAERLVLNHIGARFPVPPPGARYFGARIRANVLMEIARQASDAWGAGRLAVAATDFCRVDVPAPRVIPEVDAGAEMVVAPGMEQPAQEGRTGDVPRGGEPGSRKRGQHPLAYRPAGTPSVWKQNGAPPSTDDDESARALGSHGPRGRGNARGKRPRLDGRGRGRGRGRAPKSESALLVDEGE